MLIALLHEQITWNDHQTLLLFVDRNKRAQIEERKRERESAHECILNESLCNSKDTFPDCMHMIYGFDLFRVLGTSLLHCLTISVRMVYFPTVSVLSESGRLARHVCMNLQKLQHTHTYNTTSQHNSTTQQHNNKQTKIKKNYCIYIFGRIRMWPSIQVIPFRTELTAVNCNGSVCSSCITSLASKCLEYVILTNVKMQKYLRPLYNSHIHHFRRLKIECTTMAHSTGMQCQRGTQEWRRETERKVNMSKDNKIKR